MKASPFAYPIEGDVLVIPCFGPSPVQVVHATRWRVRLELFGDPARPVLATWWLWWFRFRCRRAKFICTMDVWPRRTR